MSVDADRLREEPVFPVKIQWVINAIAALEQAPVQRQKVYGGGVEESIVLAPFYRAVLLDYVPLLIERLERVEAERDQLAKLVGECSCKWIPYDDSIAGEEQT